MKSVNYFAKSYILDIWQGSKYASALKNIFLADLIKFRMTVFDHQAIKEQTIDPICIYRRVNKLFLILKYAIKNVWKFSFKVKPLNRGHLRVFKKLSVIERCQLLVGNLKKILTFGTERFVCYSWHVRWLGCPLGSFTVLIFFKHIFSFKFRAINVNKKAFVVRK